MLEVNNLRISFGTHNAVCGINFSLEHGQSLAIVGESGSGKSQFVKTLSEDEIPSYMKKYTTTRIGMI